MTVTQTALVPRAGAPQPYGASVVAGGVNFSVQSASATSMTLVLFHRGARQPFAEIPFPAQSRTGAVWAMTVAGLDPAHIEYGYRVDGTGPVLTDPYARALGGRDEWGVVHGPGYQYPHRARIVADDGFDWAGDRPPGLPMRDLVIYETHVRGFTRHPSSGVRAPGTFAGLAEKIPYLRELGVNCVELLPVFEFDECDNHRANPLTGGRLHNYWGYSTLGFFAPKASYAATARGDGPRTELKRLVQALHRAGIEVILDVVFNHTAEGDQRGPSISFRGLDDAVWYMHAPDGSYLNFSGTGNTFNCNHPVVREFVLDCLRHWVTQFHVDGFRFDLAPILGRGEDGTPLADPPLLRAIAADPVLRDTKLIAEPWDAGGLYQLGGFPGYGRFAEWNGRYRDGLRRFLRGDPASAGELATRLAGSPDLYAGRGPAASVNFIGAHDGFTLHDLFAYDDKHNEANGEGNRDGERDNLSWNCGAEGPTDDPDVLELRARQARNAILLLLTSHGVPMLTAGDEMGRTQRGNNNAYCQDNEVSWVDWTLAERNGDLVAFTRRAIAFRRAHPALRRDTHASGAEIRWHGSLDWDGPRPLVAVELHDEAAGDAVFVAANGHWEPAELELPPPPAGHRWQLFADTGDPAVTDVPAPSPLTVGPRTVVVLSAVEEGRPWR